jgi:hypothetical protein
MACLVVCGWWIPATDAATPAASSTRTAMLRAAATSGGGEAIGLHVSERGRATVAPSGRRGPAQALAVRSSIDASWGLVVVSPEGNDGVRQTLVLEQRRGRWQVRLWASLGDERSMLCRSGEPGTAVALDLGLDTLGSGGRCRHRRDATGLTRAMSGSEIASVRAMVEWRYSDVTFQLEPGPVQPGVKEVFASDCAWDGRGSAVDPPYGRVARSDPRWGVAIVTCVTGSDGFALLENPTMILVRRAGTSGSFTAPVAHTYLSWSIQGQLCHTDRRWPIPAAPRVALQFCTPFPAALGDARR